MAVAADAETSESFDPNGYFKNANGGIFSEVELAGETDPLRSGNAVPNSEVYNIPVLETKPPNYMWLALCTTVFFNPLSGIIALVLASKYPCLIFCGDTVVLENSYILVILEIRINVSLFPMSCFCTLSAIWA